MQLDMNRRVTRSSGAFINQDSETMEIKMLSTSRTKGAGTLSTSNLNGVRKQVLKKAKIGSKAKKRPGRFRIAYTNRKAIKLLSESGNNELSRDSMSFLTDEEKLLLSSWGLPSQVLAKYRHKGVTSLFQWQLDCLDNEKVLKGSNILYSAPTSAGKTLVAEILMLKRVLELGKKAIIILPFVSVAREKMYSLQELFGDVGIRVEGFMGSYNPPGGFQQVDIAVCTIEKANSLINRLLEEGGLSQLGTVVVDELHLIGDPHRGYLLELLLTKIRFASTRISSQRNTSLTMSLSNASIYSHHESSTDGSRRNGKLSIQIIGMSATLPNLTTLANWLEAELVVSDFRPVPLVEHIKLDDALYNSSLEKVGPVLKDPLLALSNDPDHIISLSLETILDGHSILIFCPSKQMCETVAVQISREFFNIGNPNIMSGRSIMLGEKLRQQLHGSRISEVLAQLTQCPSGLDEALRKAVSFGVAFHHAGLTFDERDIIESGFKRGIIRVMVATSTLSAGVNLPARRVLIVTPTFDALDVLTYRQMSGRAGRKGVDTQGESILICDPRTQRRALGLIQSNLPPVSSALIGANGSVSHSMKRALLEVIASGTVQSPMQVTEYTKCTLSYHIGEEGSDHEGSDSRQTNTETITKCLEFLEKNDFIRLKTYESEEKSPEYMTTQLGSACLASSLSPDEGIVVFKELQKARRCFVLENELHVIYQVTPIYIADQWRSLDWNQFLTIWQGLSPDEKEVGRLIGVHESFIVKAMMGVVSWKNPSQLASLNVHQRFYTALALNDLVNEMPISQVAQKYSVNKGVVQNLQQAASTFAGMVTAFSGRLGWSNLELLLSQFQERLQFGVQRELVDLVRLDLLNGQRARILHNAGIKTISDLATSEPATIAQILHQAGPFRSNVHGGGQSAKSIWMLGKDDGLTENEAAQMIVEEARNFLQIELGLAGVQFRKEEIDENSDKENQDVPGVVEEIEENGKLDNTEISNVLDSYDGNNGMVEVLDESHRVPPMLKRNQESLIHRTFRDDSGDPILSGLCKTPRNQSDSPVTTVTALVSALKHSTPLHGQMDLEKAIAAETTSITNPDLKRDDVQGLDGFDFEKEFLHSHFDTSVFVPPNDEPKAEKEGYVHLLTTSFMDVSLNVSSSDEGEAPQAMEEARETPLLSESILEAAAAIAGGNDSDSDSSIDCFPPSQEQKILKSEKSQKIGSSSSNKVSVSVYPEPTYSDEDEDTWEMVSPPKNYLTPDLNYFQQELSIHVFGKEFKVKKILLPERLPESVFRSDGVVGLGLNVAPPPPSRVSNGIGNRVMGRRPSMSKVDTVTHSLAFCNGCRDTVWIYEWNPCDERGLTALWKKVTSASSDLSILGAKDKFKTLLQNSNVQLSQLPNEKRIWDPKIAQWLLRFDEDRPISQDEMVRLWIDSEDARKLQVYRVQSSSGGKMRKGVVEALIGWKLMEVLREKLTSGGLWEHFVEIETQTTRSLLLMELNGFKINLDEMGRLKGVLEFYEAILELSAYRIAGRQFNLSSSKDISQIFRHDLGFGNQLIGCGTGKDVLKKLDHELARVILEWRKVTGALRKTVVPFMTGNVPGRIHGHYAHFTVTGRVVMAEPSLQCVPRDFNLGLSYTETQLEEIRHHSKIKFGNKVAPLLEKIEKRQEGGGVCGAQGLISLRNAFIPSDGFLLLSADYSQLELRILAHLAQEKKLIRILNTPTGDVFREIAAQWKCIPESEVSDEMRQEAKGITYGIIYGMGAKTLSDQLGVDEREASDFIRGFMWAYPGIRTFIDQTIKSCRELGFVETISGRRRYLEHINSNSATQRAQAERQAVNSKIQGSASDLVKRAMTRIQSKLSDLCPASGNPVKWTSPDPATRFIAFPVLNLHDELIYEIRESHLVSVATEIKEQMESCLKLDVNTPVVIKVGRSWGQLRPYPYYCDT